MKIVLADDEDSIRNGIENYLVKLGHSVKSFSDGTSALNGVLSESCELVISDVMMPNLNGIQFLEELKNKLISIPFIVITAFAKVEDAVYAMKLGAEDYLTKPINLLELKIKIEKIERKRNLIIENEELKRKIDSIAFSDLIGESNALREIKLLINRYSTDCHASIMVYGASGTGKEVVARNIHLKSKRADKPFVALNCAALPDELLESELFGYVKGAFTGAEKDRTGIFRAADGGTIFLDEVSEMSPRLQVKLLRALQEKTIQPLGTTEQIKIDIRIIGASNKNLQLMINEGKFREDLFYRLNVLEIYLKPLSERIEDLPCLIKHFQQKINNEKRLSFTPEAFSALEHYNWPGNIRELENLINFLLVTVDNSVAALEDLPEKIRSSDLDESSYKELAEDLDYKTLLQKSIEKFEKEFLLQQIKKNNYILSRAASSMGLSRVSLYKKIKQYNLLKEETGV
jgi:DNA-binding NtrC family response regulator